MGPDTNPSVQVLQTELNIAQDPIAHKVPRMRSCHYRSGQQEELLLIIAVKFIFLEKHNNEERVSVHFRCKDRYEDSHKFMEEENRCIEYGQYMYKSMDFTQIELLL